MRTTHGHDRIDPGDGTAPEQPPSDAPRTLRQRHVRMIALGGIVGASLFVGSGAVIHTVGPASILSYALGGLLVILVMRMLGEMATASPTLGSFMEYARTSLGGWAGYTIGWLYWYFWVGVVAFEAVAGAKLLMLWIPGVPQWLLSLVLMTLLTATNLVSTRSFGETEFWLASIKVVTIVVFLVAGTLFTLGLWPDAKLSVGNVALDGFAPNGLSAILHGVVLVIFSYVGTEIVTIAAAESDDPVKSVVKATSSTVWRVIIFYVGSVTLLVMMTPWDLIPTETSPYAAAFGKMGVPAATTIINVVVLTSVLSVLNSGLYTASRMLFALQSNKWAPRWVAHRSRKGTPWKAILACTSVGYVAVAMSYVAPDTIFNFIINSAGAVGLFVYAIIAGSQLRMRRQLEREAPERIKLRMWGYPYLSWATLAAIIIVLSSMLLVPDARSQLYLSILSLAAILATYVLVRSRRRATTH
ncbi:amino acid permease [Streptomyces endophyticus]|uniref:Amino acid permease n=1 Tax=Streptomyces endophyticus TaxID=714166 RepID=A0ABU6FFV9_9ACTN|nr:amino acid permease [Streptomyces endophyticus]MEB8342925.1 amino acid permease [Streptomyces endophyticus]